MDAVAGCWLNRLMVGKVCLALRVAWVRVERVSCPRWLWRSAAEVTGEATEQRGLRTRSGEGDAHARCGLTDAGGQLQQPHADGGELRPVQRVKSGMAARVVSTSRYAAVCGMSRF
jgi:hypothetical protein